MSTTLDQRVVSLQFDNKQFERNTATTMSTLDKLKEKLTFNKASKGLEDVGHAAKNVNLNGLGSGIEAVSAKFSALQVMGVTALANITNSAVNAGKRIVSALTIDPVKTGFSEYETQINATQTILANTKSKGSTIDDVNKALEELNKYADKTIYNFTEMTRNIGTFTAAGVDLETSVNAIQGIANLAAVSGSTSQQASTAMYQLSQALSTGTVRLTDWNSVVNAGMGGEMFQNALRETSKELKTGAEAAIEAKGSFRESLSEGWLTAEVLTQTLKKFTTSGANEYIAKYTGLSQDAIETTLREAEATAEAAKAKGKEADAIDIAAESLAKMSGKSKKQIKESLEFAKTAEDAATKVKTFTQLWEVLKESAQSGWSQTWKLIVGDFEGAKNLLTPFADFLTGFINKISDWRNRILQIALDFSKPWKEIAEKIGKVSEKVGKVSDVVSKVTGTLEYFQEVVDKVWHGDFNNNGDNPDRRDLLRAAGYDPKVVQYLVNLGEEAHKAGKKYKLTAEDIEAAHKKYGKTVKATAEETEATADAFNNLSDEKLKDAGLTEEEIRLYRALEEEAAKAEKTIDQLAKEMSETDGRTMLIDSFKNVGKLIGEIAGAAKKALGEIFDIPSAEVLGIRLYGVIRSLKKFTESLTIVDKETGKLTKNGENIKSIFKGLFAAIDIVITLTAGPLKFVFKMLTQLCGVLGIGVLDIAGSLGEFIVKIRDGIDNTLDFTKLFEKIVPPIKKALSAFKGWISKLKESKNLPKDIAMGIASGFGKAWTAIKKFFKNLPENISNGFAGLSESPLGGFIDKLKSGFKVAAKVVVELGKMIRDKIKGYLSRATFEEISSDSVDGLTNGLRDKASSVWKTAVEMVKNLVQKVKDFLGIHSPSTVFFAIGGFIVAGLVGGITSALQNGDGLLQGFKDFFTPVIEWLKGVDMGQLFAGVMGTGIVLMIKRILDIIDKFSAPAESLGELFGEATKILKDNAKNFSNVVKSFAKNLKAEAFKTRMEGFMTFVKALVLLIAAIAVLTFFDPKKLLIAVGIVAAIGLVLAGLMFLMNLINKASVSFDLKNGFKADGLMSGLLGLGIAILLIGKTIKTLGSLNKEEALRGITLLGGIVLGLIALSVTLGLLNKFNAGNFGGTIFKLAAGIAIIAIVVKLLGGMKPETLRRGIWTVTLLSGLIVGLMAATKLIGAGSNVATIGKALMGVAGAIAIMALTVRLIGGMKPEKLQSGIKTVTLLSGLIVGLMAATKLIGGGSNVNAIGKALMGVAVAIGVMGLTVRLIGGMDPSELERGTQVVATLALIIVGLMAATRLIGAGGNVGKIGGALMGVAVAIGAMGLVVALLGMISVEGLNRGLSAVTALSTIMVGLMAATRLLGGRESIEKAGSCLLAVAGAIGILAVVAIALGFVPIKHLVKGVLFVGILSAMMAGLMAVTKLTKFSEDSMKNLLVIAGIIALLAGILIAMSYLKTDEINTASTAMAKVIGMVALLMFATKYIANVKFKQLIGPMATLVVVIALLATIVTIMANNLSNVDAVIPAAIALGIMMGALAGTIAILAAVGKLINSNGVGILKGIGLLTLLLIPLAGAAFILAKMSGLENATSIIKALLMFVGGITLLLLPLALIGVIAVPALYGIAVMAVLVAALATMTIGLGALVSSVPGMQEFVDTGIAVLIQLAQGIGDMIAAFTTSVSEAGLLKVLAVFLMMPLLITGIAILLPLMLTVGAVAAGIGALMNSIDGLQGFLETGLPVILQLADAIAQMIAAFTTTVSSAGLLEVLAVFAMIPLLTVGLSLLLPLMLAIGTVATVIGGLVSHFPQLEKFLDIGLPILIRLASGIGEMIGAFVSSIVTEIASTLPMLGKMLSMFMLNAMPFIMGAKMVDEKVLAGVGILAGAILALTVADLITGVTSFLQGGSSFADLGTQLSMFMMNAMPFILGASLISEDMLTGVKMLADTILVLTAANVIDGLTSWLTGGSSLASFSEQLPFLGKGLADFSANLGTFTEEQMTTVKFAAEAVKTLAAAASEIPNSGGLLASIVGENDLSTFGAMFPFLGRGLRGFLDNIGTFTDEQVTTVNCAAEAVKTLAAAASEIPNSGGWVDTILGGNDLSVFAGQFPFLGRGLRGFLDAIGTFSEEQVSTVTCAADAVKSLASAASEIPNAGGWIGAIIGENNLGEFGAQFPFLGRGLRGFLDNVGTLTDDDKTAITVGADALKTIANAASEIPNTGGFISFFTGDNSLGAFAAEFPKLGAGLSGFVASFGSASVDDVVDGVNAFVYLVDWLTYLIGAFSVDSVTSMGNAINVFGDDVHDAFEEFGAITPDYVEVLNVTFDALKRIGSEIVPGDVTCMSVAFKKLADVMFEIKKIKGEDAAGLVSMVDALIGINFKDFGFEVVYDFMSGINTVKKEAQSAFAEMVLSCLSTVRNGSIIESFKHLGQDLAKSIADGMTEKEKTITGKLTATLSKVRTSIRDTYDFPGKFKSLGKSVASGFADGISENAYLAEAKAAAMASAAYEAARKELDVNSPSKIFRALGTSVPEGFAMGIDKLGSMVTRSSTGMADNAIGTVTKTLSRISDIATSDIDAQPTIRPIMDLSDVRDGANAIGSLLNTESSIGVVANAGRIGGMMNRYSQNRGNGDVVAAIDKLNKRMDNLGNTSYNINGITYDDGSNISAAVQTLVRAARIERRT